MTDAPARPSGDSDDLLVAYQHGAASTKDQIRELEAERDEALKMLSVMTRMVQILERQGERSQRVENERDKLIENLAAERDKLRAERDAMREALERPLLPLSFYQEAALKSQKRAEKAEAERDKLQEVINQMRAIVETDYE